MLVVSLNLLIIAVALAQQFLALLQSSHNYTPLKLHDADAPPVWYLLIWAEQAMAGICSRYAAKHLRCSLGYLSTETVATSLFGG